MPGDPLSLLLFLFVVQGLAGMMQKAVALGEYQDFHVEDHTYFGLLQFADDIILISDSS